MITQLTYTAIKEIQKQIPNSEIHQTIGAFGLWEFTLIIDGIPQNIEVKNEY